MPDDDLAYETSDPKSATWLDDLLDKVAAKDEASFRREEERYGDQ